MASQPLEEVSRCQELDCAVEPSRRRTDASLLTTNKRSVSIVFGAMGELDLDDSVEDQLREIS
jgi:hypothetical protein